MGLLNERLINYGWRFEDMRRFGRGYVRYYRDTYDDAPAGTPKIYEENLSYINRDSTVAHSAHTFLITVFSGESADMQSADLLTTFGVDPADGKIVVTQVEGPGQAEVNAGVQLYDLYGIQEQSSEIQWQALQNILET